MGFLDINHATKSYGSVEVLHDVNIAVEEGEFLVLVGPSGCGKSTLLNMIAGLEDITTGDISIKGSVMNGVHPSKRNIAMVFQSYALYPNMTVGQNITFGLEMHGVPKAERDKAMDDVAKLLQIEPLLSRRPAQLSGGQRQRVAMGRALVRDPDVFLFDEPLSNLDAKLRVDMRTEIKKLHQKLGTTIVYVTHDQIEALTLSTRIAVMNGGYVQQLGTPKEIYDTPANIFVASFMGSPSMNLLEMTVQAEGDSVYATTQTNEGAAVRLKCANSVDALRAYDGKRVILGIRPEAITDPDSADLAGGDPTDPDRDAPYPNPAVPDEPVIADIRGRLKRLGVSPSSLPLALDFQRWQELRDGSWDGHPDAKGAKLDAESIGIEQARQHSNFELVTGARVSRLLADDQGRISEVRYLKDGESHTLSAKLIVLSAGAVNSPALLLASANEAHPSGLANSSDLVGRRFMNHNCSALMAIHPLRRNTSTYQKTLYFNDFYLSGGPDDAPLGNVQLLGKITSPILQAQTALPKIAVDWLTGHSVDWYVMSEDLPSEDSRVTLKDDQIVLDWKRSNWRAHELLVTKTKQLLRRAGYPIQLSRPFDRRTPSHQCGTAVFGPDPASSVLDLHCRTHDHDNLYVVDASFLPTSAAVNPALTIAAQALRVADHIKHKELAA